MNQLLKIKILSLKLRFDSDLLQKSLIPFGISLTLSVHRKWIKKNFYRRFFLYKFLLNLILLVSLKKMKENSKNKKHQFSSYIFKAEKIQWYYHIPLKKASILKYSYKILQLKQSHI